MDEQPSDDERVNGAVASVIIGVPIVVFLIVIAAIVAIMYGG